MTYASYRQIETSVLMWGDARKITTNGTSIGQAKKTVEEANELLAACEEKNLAEAKDAIGDVLVTLVMCAECLTRETGEAVDVVDCFRMAYEEIKDRTGHLTPGGIFVKDEK